MPLLVIHSTPELVDWLRHSGRQKSKNKNSLYVAIKSYFFFFFLSWPSRYWVAVVFARLFPECKTLQPPFSNKKFKYLGRLNIYGYGWMRLILVFQLFL